MQGQAQREKVTFETNVPVLVAIQPAFPVGKPVEGRYGDQFLYYWTGDRLSYVQPEVEAQIKMLGIRPGEEFTICKRECRDGNRKWIEWQVERVEQPAPQPLQPLVGRAAAGTRAEPCGSHDNGNGTAAAKVNGHAAIAGIPVFDAKTELQACIQMAIEIAPDVEKFAASRSCSVRFTSEDIRAIGISLFIERTRSRGLPWQR